MSKRGRYQPKYTPHTAKRRYECFVCGGAISPCEIYLGRKIFKEGKYQGTIRKCGQCVTIQEVNGNE